MAKLAVLTTPVITAVLNGASTGSGLPTSLSDGSVTTDGNPAFVEVHQTAARATTATIVVK